MQPVAGQKDPVMQRLRALTGEEGRRREGLFLVEGDVLVPRAFDYGGRVDAVILNERYLETPPVQAVAQRAREAGATLYRASDGLLAKMLEAKPTPECLAFVERRVAALPEALAGECPLALMVEHGENADNLGMLLRSTDAAGVSGVVLAAETTDPFSRRVVRGSRGAVFTVPLAIEHDPLAVIDAARARGLRVLATSAQAPSRYTEADFREPVLLIVGNEHTGISASVRAAVDRVLRIPMYGKINSLNIAVAASIVLYEAARQREAGA